jgi:hypothetical protein
VIANWRLRARNVMIQMDSAVASRVLRVACVNAVTLASGTIAETDACVSTVINIMKLIQAFYKMWAG